ncbi:hypothetical protein V8C86DRAFT_2853563 [Haematococcus lacustris]
MRSSMLHSRQPGVRSSGTLCGLRKHLGCPRTYICQANPSSNEVVFGKPSAPRDVFESIARSSRDALLREIELPDGCSIAGRQGAGSSLDVVLAALHVASEDDAIKSRTHIPLPVEAFSARLDTVAAECAAMFPANLTQQQQLDHIQHHLFDTWGLRVAGNLEAGLFSPYRVYMHNVLAQRCGTQAACAAVLHSLLRRLLSRGSIDFCAQVGLPTDVAARPVARIQGPAQDTAQLSSTASPSAPSQPSSQADSHTGTSSSSSPPSVSPPDDTVHDLGTEAGAGAAGSGASQGLLAGAGSGVAAGWGPEVGLADRAGLVQWVEGRQLVAELLDQLKRAYWSWDWPLGAASGFEACAQGLLGRSGRAGRVNAAVGVMQATGRPFGNVELALLASERAVQVAAVMDKSSWEYHVQVRDLAMQLLHVGQSSRGCSLLRDYQAWLEADPGNNSAVGSYADLVANVLLAEQRRALEGAFLVDAGDPDILDPDRD